MNRIQLHNGIQKIIDGYIRFGFWCRNDKATLKEMSLKMFYSVYYSLFLISLITGAIISVNKDECMLLVHATILCSSVLLRLLYIMWRQKGMYELLHRIGVYSIKFEEDFYVVDNKLNSFMTRMTYFWYYVVVSAACVSLGVPLMGNENKLFFNIGFPLDYKTNDFAYWIAFLFLSTEVYLSAIAISFSIMIWYLLFNCTLKYQVLGSELRNMGAANAVVEEPISETEKRNLFNRDLIVGIKSHQDINEVTQQLETFFSELFSLQLATSAACICSSVYILAFNESANIIEYQIYIFDLLYTIGDIFVVMYFGNEILLSSDGLSYSLFQSNWMDQSESCKKTIIIFGERLKQAQQIIILKLYPLTLETFTRIINGAYSMFNILKTLTH